MRWETPTSSEEQFKLGSQHDVLRDAIGSELDRGLTVWARRPSGRRAR
ncbi:hypothetical protein [Streptomyces antimycoticus]|nr:hypothetical protein [Streptomyces antimycoticus]